MQTVNRVEPRRVLGLFGVIALVAGLVLPLLPVGAATAAQIPSPRSLTLIAGADGPDADSLPDGGSQPGGNVKHKFSFSLASGNDLGSIKLQYCTTAAPVPNGTGCIAPAGINLSSAAVESETGTVAGFTTVVPSNEDDDTGSSTPINTVTLERAAVSGVSAGGTVIVTLTGVVNPSSAMTFYVRISTYGTTDGSGAVVDSGTVAAATSTQIVLSGTMPESLVFCAGASVGLNGGGVPDCGTVVSGLVAFDRLFSPTDTALATSQMAASTNAGQGYAITVNGPTLTSGTNTINAMTANGLSSHGVSQFGMNLVANDGTADSGKAPNLSNMSAALEPNAADVSLTSNGTSLNGRAYPGYDAGGTHNGTFKFNTGDTVADSDFNNVGTPIGSDSQIFTVSYIANVPGNQPAGSYTTTLTYICTPTF